MIIIFRLIGGLLNSDVYFQHCSIIGHGCVETFWNRIELVMYSNILTYGLFGKSMELITFIFELAWVKGENDCAPKLRWKSFCLMNESMPISLLLIYLNLHGSKLERILHKD